MSLAAASVASVGAAAVAASATGLCVSAWTRRVHRELSRHPDPWQGTYLGSLEGSEHSVVTDDGTKLRVIELGDPNAPAVLLVHGYVANTSTWALVAPLLLSAGYRVVAFDQRGHGRSDVGRDGCGIEPIGRDLAAVVEHRQLDGALVVGHSMGAISVLSMAAQRRDLFEGPVAAVVLLSTTAKGPGRPMLIEMKRFRTMAWFERARRRPHLGRAFARRAFGAAPPLSLVDASWRAYLATAVRTLNEAGEPLLDFDLRHATASVTVPAAVGVGGRDTITPVACAEALAEALPTSRLVVWPDAGHVTPLEHPVGVVDLVTEMFPLPVRR